MSTKIIYNDHDRVHLFIYNSYKSGINNNDIVDKVI